MKYEKISSLKDLHGWLSKRKVIKYTIESLICTTTNSIVIRDIEFKEFDKGGYINITGFDSALDVGTNLSINTKDCENEIRYLNRFDIYTIKTENANLYIC